MARQLRSTGALRILKFDQMVIYRATIKVPTKCLVGRYQSITHTLNLLFMNGHRISSFICSIASLEYKYICTKFNLTCL